MGWALQFEKLCVLPVQGKVGSDRPEARSYAVDLQARGLQEGTHTI